jgi:hypothetical protein
MIWDIRTEYAGDSLLRLLRCAALDAQTKERLQAARERFDPFAFPRT